MRYIILLFCALFTLTNTGFAEVVYKTRVNEMQQDLNKCNAIFNSGDRIKSKSCFYSMIQKYKTSMDTPNIPLIHFNYGLSLYRLKDYKNAKAEFEFVKANEKYNKKLIEDSNKLIAEISTLLANIKAAQMKDSGNYYTKLDSVAKWENPRYLRVHIASSTGKEYILRKAFAIWDEKLEPVHFHFVSARKEADIIASITGIDEAKGDTTDRIGVCIYSKIIKNQKNYLNKADVKVSYQDFNKTALPDIEILGIALHEIGHAMGITSHSADRGDIMYPDTSSYKIVSPSNRDVNTVRKIYKDY